ncbi:4'-phosphopantetheinyl transferase family protein [Bacteroidota bacterium]
MPVVKIENISDDSCWGLWKIEETPESLMDLSFLSNEEIEELSRISNLKRKKEWLGARALLKYVINKHLSWDYRGTFKDENNKPFLHNHSAHISIAHSFPYAVALLNRNSACGIDIEKPKPALFHVAPKFLNTYEFKNIKHMPENLCLTWAAKEVLYKLHGKQKLSFKENLHIDPESLNSKKGLINAEIELSETCTKYSLVYEIMESYVICYSL